MASRLPRTQTDCPHLAHQGIAGGNLGGIEEEKIDKLREIRAHGCTEVELNSMVNAARILAIRRLRFMMAKNTNKERGRILPG
jgi:hypothetical protein